MSGQSLDGGEILVIRWAFDDPNPVAQDSIVRADKDAITSLLENKGISLEQAPFAYPASYQMPEAKRLRLEDGTAVDPKLVDLLTQHPELAYPDTEGQYSAPSTSSLPQASSATTDWSEHTDPDTGATYFYNTKSGESSWTQPE